MLALDVNLQQSWRGEELLALLTFVELHICEAREERTIGGSVRLENSRAGGGMTAST